MQLNTNTNAIETQIQMQLKHKYKYTETVVQREREGKNLMYVQWGKPWRCYTYLRYHDDHVKTRGSPLIGRFGFSFMDLGYWDQAKEATWSMMNCIEIWRRLDRTCYLFGLRPCWYKGDIAHVSTNTNTKMALARLGTWVHSVMSVKEHYMELAVALIL